MNIFDWVVLVLTLGLIVGYGSWKTRANTNIHGYLLGGKEAQWFTVALSIMATQASAITFLSAPGQAYTEGMGFVQFYLGLPLAMVVLCVTVVPIYHRLNVYTAYEYLEKRFDLKTRALAAFLFLLQRGLAAGFTIFSPALILSSLLGWSLVYTNLGVGLLVIIYTVTGGTRTVNVTQKYQMLVILIGMVAAGVTVVQLFPEQVSFGDALSLAGSMNRMEIIDPEFDLENKYTIWSGLIGGFFLALSYFGTDQSQVQRYLSASSIRQSRLGLIFNGMTKIPMQFLILLVGVLLYVLYLFVQPPVFFNQQLLSEVQAAGYGNELAQLQQQHEQAYEQRKQQAFNLHESLGAETEAVATEQLRQADAQLAAVRGETLSLIETAVPNADTNDVNYIFIHFVLTQLPIGLVGLLIAVILSASMSSTASELNALASTTIVDIYKRMFKPNASDKHYLNASKLATVLWGFYAIAFAMVANQLGTLIEAVNVLGSLVYGTILGIFLSAFYVKRINGNGVFVAGVLTEALVLLLWPFEVVPYLWLNVIGCLSVMAIALLLQQIFPKNKE
jgi:SSS family transporter